MSGVSFLATVSRPLINSDRGSLTVKVVAVELDHLVLTNAGQWHIKSNYYFCPVFACATFGAGIDCLLAALTVVVKGCCSTIPFPSRTTIHWFAATSLKASVVPWGQRIVTSTSWAEPSRSARAGHSGK